MKPKSKYEREILRFVKAITDQFQIERTRSGHIKVIFEGIQKVSVIFGGSPSDHRSTRNSYSDVRRAVVIAGVELKEA